MTPVSPADLILGLRFSLQAVPRGCPEMTPFGLIVRHPGLCRGCPEMTPVWPNSAPADLILGLRFQELSRHDSGLALF